MGNTSDLCEKCGRKLGRYAKGKICFKCKTGKDYFRRKQETKAKLCKICGGLLKPKARLDVCPKCRGLKKRKMPVMAPCQMCGKPVSRRNVTGLCKVCWLANGKHKEALNGTPPK